MPSSSTIVGLDLAGANLPQSSHGMLMLARNVDGDDEVDDEDWAEEEEPEAAEEALGEHHKSIKP